MIYREFNELEVELLIPELKPRIDAIVEFGILK